MREILFRGKSPITGIWHYGELINTSGKIPPYYPMILEIDDEGEESYYTADPDSVGQFTGLTDKNGKQIFEGDVIECWIEGVKARGTVQQNRGGLWTIHPAWQKHIMWWFCPSEDGTTDVEIIGNTQDNPELLEV